MISSDGSSDDEESVDSKTSSILTNPFDMEIWDFQEIVDDLYWSIDNWLVAYFVGRWKKHTGRGWRKDKFLREEPNLIRPPSKKEASRAKNFWFFDQDTYEVIVQGADDSRSHDFVQIDQGDEVWKEKFEQFEKTDLALGHLMELLYEPDIRDIFAGADNIPRHPLTYRSPDDHKIGTLAGDSHDFLKFIVYDAIRRYSIASDRKVTRKPYVVHTFSTARVLIEHNLGNVEDIARALSHDIIEEEMDFKIDKIVENQYRAKYKADINELDALNASRDNELKKKRQNKSKLKRYDSRISALETYLSDERAEIKKRVKKSLAAQPARNRSLIALSINDFRYGLQRFTKEMTKGRSFVTDESHVDDDLSSSNTSLDLELNEYARYRGQDVIDAVIPSLMLLTRGTKENYYVSMSNLFDYVPGQDYTDVPTDSIHPIKRLEDRLGVEIKDIDIENAIIVKFADRIANTTEMRLEETPSERAKRLGDLSEVTLTEILDAYGMDRDTGALTMGPGSLRILAGLEDRTQKLAKKHPKGNKRKGYFQGNDRLYQAFKTILFVQKYRQYKYDCALRGYRIVRQKDMDKLENTLLEEAKAELQQIMDHISSYHIVYSSDAGRNDLTLDTVAKIYQYHADYRRKEGYTKVTDSKVDILKDDIDDMRSKMFDGLLKRLFETRIRGEKEPLKKIYNRKPIMLASAIALGHLLEIYKADKNWMLPGIEKEGLEPKPSGRQPIYESL